MAGGGSNGAHYLTEDLVLLIVGTLLVSVNIATVAHAICARSKTLWRQCHEAFCQKVSPMWRRTADEEDPLKAHIIQGMRSKEAQGMRELAVIFTAPVCTSAASIVFNIATHTPRWMSMGQTATIMFYLAVLTLTRTVCARCSSTRPTVFYCLSMLSLCLFIGTVQGHFAFVIMSEGCSFFLRCILSVKFYRLGWVTFWNLAYFAAIAWMSLTEVPDYARQILTYQVFSSAMVVLISVLSGRAVKARVRDEAEHAALRNESSGLWHLLDLVCDVVVPLDDQLRIMDKSARFSALVMMQGKNVQGTCLKDFMPDDEDREAFERCATSPALSLAEETVPRATHVKLRDGLGNQIRVELFCVQVQQLVGKRHFIGIREFSDCALLPEFKRFPGRPTRGRRRTPRSMPRRAPGPPPPDVATSDLARRVDGDGSTCSRAPAAPAPVFPSPVASEPTRTLSRSNSECSRPSCPAEPPPTPTELEVRFETSDEAIQMSIVRILRMLHISAGGIGATARCETGDSAEGCCCPFHARVARIRDCVRSLGLRQCVRKFKAVDWLQCNMCGLLSEPSGRGGGETCFACQSDLRERLTLAL